MTDPTALFDINPAIDRAAAARAFAADRRVQIRNLLTEGSARALHDVLANRTPWGLAWKAGEDGPHGLRREDVTALPEGERRRIGAAIGDAMRGRDYAFSFGQYRILDAYIERWAPGGPHDILLEYVNSQPFIDLAREVTGLPHLVKADAQATSFGPGQFLAEHIDSHVGEGWEVAYVLNLCAVDWRPDWGGYLNFLDANGDIVAGYKPRFNALNLLAVPQPHSVGYVPPFAPMGRYAITGWLRSR